MKLIEGVSISKMCDYSFGDQSGVICNCYGSYMKDANMSNIEFLDIYNEVKKTKKVMTLFIDNIRLYGRKIKVNNENDQKWLDNLTTRNDLLYLCSQLSDMNFIIYTNLEDTPIDSYIEGRIPDNVLKIYAVNAIYNNDKVIPYPYGLQRKMNINDNRLDIIKNYIGNESIKSGKLLYVNHSINTNPKERYGINELFMNKSWATVDTSRKQYDDFYKTIKEHKFMICPEGNAVDCHRNWEVLYLGRVPVMKKNDYLLKLFKNLPVLFVNNYSDITEDMLIKNAYLFEDAKSVYKNINNLYEK